MLKLHCTCFCIANLKKFDGRSLMGGNWMDAEGVCVILMAWKSGWWNFGRIVYTFWVDRVSNLKVTGAAKRASARHHRFRGVHSCSQLSSLDRRIFISMRACALARSYDILRRRDLWDIPSFWLMQPIDEIRLWKSKNSRKPKLNHLTYTQAVR